MFTLIQLVLPFFLNYANACFWKRCRCYQSLELIDCSRVGLYTIPHSEFVQFNYTSILLRGNHLKQINFSSLVEILPRVVLIDVRGNNPKLCKDVVRFNPFESITIISDCTQPIAVITPTTAENKPTHKANAPSRHQDFTSTSNTKRNTQDHQDFINTSVHNHSITYIYALIATLVILPTSAIFIRLISRLLQKSMRSRRLRQDVQMELLNINIDEDNEDDVIFTRTTEM